MAQPFERTILYGGSYYPALPPVGEARPEMALVAGRNVWIRPEGYCESWMGMASLGVGMNAALMVPLSIDSLPGGIGTGTVLIYRSDGTAFIGSGTVYRNAASIATASNALQIRINSTNITVGLPTPAAPSVFIQNVAGKARGNFSVKISQVRPEDGEESNASLASGAVVNLKNQKIIISMNGIATPGDGKRWVVYGSDAGASQLGPWWYRLEFDSSQLTTIVDSLGNSRPNSIAVDWYDFDMLNILAPFDFAAPPPGTHLTSLGAVVTVLGTYGANGLAGGAGVSPSKVGRLAFPATYTRFLNPVEPIKRVDGRPGNGWQAVWTENSLQAILLSGDDVGPVFVRGLWPRTGILSPNGALILDNGDIFAFTSDGAMVRSNGASVPDHHFADRVRPDLKNFNPATVVLGYHKRENAVVVMDGNVAIPYLLSRDEWCPPFDMLPGGGTVQASAEVKAKLHVNISNQLYTFDTGNGSGINWRARPVDQTLGTNKRKTVFGWKGTTKGGTTAKLFGNLDYNTVLETQTDAGAGQHHVGQVKTNIKNLASFALERSGTAGGQCAYTDEVYGVVENEDFIDTA